MLDAIFSQTNYVAAKKMLDVTEVRHQAIASNIANLETPHYKRLDVPPSFVTELRNAVASGDAIGISSLRPQMAVDANAVSSRLDGNTVQLESELMELNRNTVEHSVESQLITGSLLRLRLAISGRQV